MKFVQNETISYVVKQIHKYSPIGKSISPYPND